LEKRSDAATWSDLVKVRQAQQPANGDGLLQASRARASSGVSSSPPYEAIVAYYEKKSAHTGNAYCRLPRRPKRRFSTCISFVENVHKVRRERAQKYIYLLFIKVSVPPQVSQFAGCAADLLDERPLRGDALMSSPDRLLEVYRHVDAFSGI